MSQALTTASHAPQLAYAEMERLAADMANSGLFGFKTKQEAMSIMMIAQAEGKHPATAARDYDVINKKLAKRAEAMMRDFMEGGGKVKWNALTDEVADATFTHPQGGEVRISWDMARALQAGLSSKENWRKYPRQMLRNRTVSEGVRTVWPLATSGMYERGEVEDFTGKTIDGTAEMPQEPPSDARQALNDSIPLKAAAARTPPPERKVDPTVYEAGPAPQQKSWSQWADALEVADRDASIDELGRMIAKAEVAEIVRLAQEGTPSPAKTRIVAAFRSMEERYLADPPQPPDGDADLDEVVIKGTEKLAAG